MGGRWRRRAAPAPAGEGPPPPRPEGSGGGGAVSHPHPLPRVWRDNACFKALLGDNARLSVPEGPSGMAVVLPRGLKWSPTSPHPPTAPPPVPVNSLPRAVCGGLRAGRAPPGAGRAPPPAAAGGLGEPEKARELRCLCDSWSGNAAA